MYVDHWKSQQKSKIDLILTLVFTCLGLVLMVYLLMHSPGMPVKDEIAHFNISRNAWVKPSLTLDLWGRPLNTLLYMLPALISWQAARLFSLSLSILSLLFTLLVARQFRIQRLFLIPVFLLFQPWYARIGFTVLTEVPFTLFLIAGAYFAIDKKESLASILFGMLPLIRHEGIALLAVWCGWLLIKRKFTSLMIATLPYLLFNILYYLVNHEFAIDIFLNPKPTELYGSGDWLHYFRVVFFWSGYAPILCMLFAIVRLWKTRGAATLLLYGIYFLTHVIIYRFGWFASGGYYLFLMPLAPAIAIGAAAGLEVIIHSLQKRLAMPIKRLQPSWVSFTLLTPAILVMLWFGCRTQPFSLMREERALIHASTILKQRSALPQNTYSAHQFFIYLYELPYNNWLYEPELNNFQPGSFIVWEEHFSNRWGIDFLYLSNSENHYQLIDISPDRSVAIFKIYE